MARILLADDDATVLGFVQMVLESKGYQVLTARNGSEALEVFFDQLPDVVLLDVLMPQVNGIDVCQRIRAAAPLVPIIFLTARQQVQDMVSGFDSGADDYITKPFNRHELLARVQAALRRVDAIRRQRHESAPLLDIEGLAMDTTLHQARFREQALTLSRTEFRLLQTFCEYPGQVLERDFLLQQVWGYKIAGQSRTVDNFVGRVRRKLQQALDLAGATFPHIETLYGLGYRLVTSTTQTGEK
ncbi:MAG TPA: response regulator transcription factor [Candidatus Obscuribacterales bacterium]